MRDRCEHCVDLTACRVGTSGTVSCVLRQSTDRAVVRRLAELGLREGAAVRTVQRTPGGGRVVAIGDTRLALDRATLAHLHITPAVG